MAGAWADSATVRSLPLSLPTVSVYSKDERGVPRQAPHLRQGLVTEDADAAPEGASGERRQQRLRDVAEKVVAREDQVHVEPLEQAGGDGGGREVTREVVRIANGGEGVETDAAKLPGVVRLGTA